MLFRSISLGDETAGLLAVQGVMAALLDRARTGKGQKVEVALHDGLLSLLTYHAQGWLSGGARPTRLGNAHPSIVPYQTFRAADGWINVGVGNDRQWTAFCQAIGREAWREDPRFRTNSDRVVHRAELISALEEIFAGRSTAEWKEVLSAAEIPCGRIRSVPEALESPEARAREMVTEVQAPDGPLRVVGPPVKLSATPAGVRRPPPALGAHTDQVLREAGYSAADIARLRESGVV